MESNANHSETNDITDEEIEYEIENEHLLRPIRTSNSDGVTYKLLSIISIIYFY